ncbi:PTS sugar transporter subunit IIA [Tuanshanicoccus lijuaniae]|uniref:PTS sugar transporter subunit IIA domain-containing protein n=1 Tax=Aerococcaceae bacterium zg-1292 TaxID=2774330 RepID=UPI00193520BA|nr:PTS sugar transporter subunit IIA [Aerococcaceae bacterium zg-1292]MBF6626449.1 PTS sugar transporter subunit IIA [Aerococcaceae bacterium zg-BR9]MBF6979186.1 PTS sugar transporter subunit IIA [Aerococcaceae bacterium zg-BR22]MBS4455674.1 PTS sugar transporter subunit IIA [Aerococcaceae bacterium zg-A91]MBS4457425.1 PTS sugar transporter subunit IIA [Aerococcaceae bacterium zg-BR33]
MVKIIMTGHGHYSTGILSSLHLIAGEQENVEAVDFTASMSSDDVKTALKNAIEAADTVLVLCDLLGGTPFNVASQLMGEYPDKAMNVLSGMNLAMVMEAVFARMDGTLDEVVSKALLAAQSGIMDAKTLFNASDDLEIEDGI